MGSTRLTQSLNGEWRLVLDPEDIGLKKGWFTGENLPEFMTVHVPSVWDLWVPDYDGVGWCFRDFDLDPGWQTRAVELRFEAADYFAEVWLNGIRLGEHEGGYTPFSLAATEALKAGPNILAVRLIDPHDEAGYRGETALGRPLNFHSKQIPCAKERGYFSFAGLWGSVDLIGKSPAHIKDVFIRPDIRRKRVAVTVTASESHSVRLAIEGGPYEAVGKPGELIVNFPEFELWSPDSPKLYRLQCELLANDAILDRVEVPFGMREFTVKGGQFCLNNRPIFVKGVLHQPDYPRSLVAPESEETARRELELAKAAGFNLVRLHIKTAPELTVRLCDELGLMVYEEPPIGWIQNSPWMKERCEREVREMILRDRNHPSVVIWGMLNESGNCDYIVKGGAQLIKDDLCFLARRLDPTRVIIDDSGGTNTTREPSRLIRPYRDTFEEYDDLHIYQRAPVDREIELYFLHSGEPHQLCFLSEFGFGGIENLENVIEQYETAKNTAKDARFLKEMLERANAGFMERGLDRTFGDFAAFCAAAQEVQCDAARFQIDACRSNPKLAGYCYTQLCDAGHEVCAGLLDHWRRAKPVFETLRTVQEPFRLVIDAPRTNLAPRQEVAVSVTLISEKRVEGRAEISLQVIGPTNQVLWKKKRTVLIPRSGRAIWSGTVAASGSPGPHRFLVRLMRGTHVLGQSDVELHVFPHAEPCDIPIRVLDPHNEWKERCARFARIDEHAALVHLVPPLANTVRAYAAEGLAQALAEVREGAVAIIWGPPDDWNDLASVVDPALRATSKDAVGGALSAYHYVKLHPVFDGLPARCLMQQPYRNVVASKTFLEPSDEDICGTFDTAPFGVGHYLIDTASWWGSDILVKRYGSGRVVFTHLRILENLGEDPVADCLFVNFLRHFARRSVPSQQPVAPDPRTLDWLRRERAEEIRRWMVLGMFPNWEDQGHGTAYPPEHIIDFGAAYPGWYKPIQWKRWYSRSRDGHLINLQDAFTPVYEYYPRFDKGTGYAYAEFTCPERTPAVLVVGIQDATKVWLNGQLVFEEGRHRPYKELERFNVPVMFKQGRNLLLVKVSKILGEFQFSADFKSPQQEPLQFLWWR